MAYDSSRQRTLNRQYADPSVNYYLAPGDKLASCPYYGHKILEARFTTHLSKCMMQYRKQLERNPRLPRYVICSDNWQHHVREDELKDHIKICPDVVKRLLKLENDKLDAAELDLTTGEKHIGLDVSNIKYLQKSKQVEEEDDSSDAEVEVDPMYSAKGTAISVVEENEMFDNSDSIIGGKNSSSQTSISNVKLSAKFNSSKVSVTANGSMSVQTRLPAVEEDWGKDAKEIANTLGDGKPFHDVKAIMETQHIYYIPPGMSKSERVIYRKKVAALYKKDDPNPTNMDRKSVVNAQSSRDVNTWVQVVPQCHPKQSSSPKKLFTSYPGFQTNLYDFDYDESNKHK